MNNRPRQLNSLRLYAAIAVLLTVSQGCATLQVDVSQREPLGGDPTPPTLQSLGEIAAQDVQASGGHANEENWASLRSVSLNPDPESTCLITADRDGNWLIKPLPFQELNRFRVRNILTPEEAIPGRQRVAASRVNLALANAMETYESAARRELPSLEWRIATLGARLRTGWASNPAISKDAHERIGLAIAVAERMLAAGARSRPDDGRPITDRAIDRLYALTVFKTDAGEAIEKSGVNAASRNAANSVLENEVRATAEPSLTELSHVAAMYEGVLLLVDRIDAK